MVRRLGLVAFGTASLMAVCQASCSLDLKPYVDPVDAGPFRPSDGGFGADGDPASTDAPPSLEAATDGPIGDAGDGAGGPIKRVFVTSTLTTGAFGGLAGAEAICKAAATNLGGTYVPWVSVIGTNALGRLTGQGPWFLVDNKTRVFANRNAITAMGPDVAVDHDEKNAVVAPSPVWTGTQASGGAGGQNCANFTTIEPPALMGLGGQTNVKNNQWTEASTFPCSQMGRIYCFEQ